MGDVIKRMQVKSESYYTTSFQIVDEPKFIKIFNLEETEKKVENSDEKRIELSLKL